MTESKRNPNPFIRMAEEARKKQEEQQKIVSQTAGKINIDVNRKSKPNKGFGGPTVVRRSGRGG